MPLAAVKVTVVPALGTPLVTVVPLIFSVGPMKKAVPVQLTACHVNPVLAPVSTILTVLPEILGDAGSVINPEAADVGAAQCGCARQRREPVHQQRRSGGVFVARQLHAFENLQRNDGIQQAQRHENRRVPPAPAIRDDVQQIHWPRQIKPQRQQRLLRRHSLS